MNPQPSAVVNISRRVERIMSVNAIILVLATLIVIITTLLSFQSIKTYHTIKQEIQTIGKSQQNTTELLDYVDQNREIVAQIESVFPTESSIDIAYEKILDAAKKIDENATLKLKANIPGIVNQQAILPMELDLSTNASGAMNLLRIIERLPYIIEVSNIELTNPLNENGVGNIQIRLYVANDFSQL